MKHSYKKVFIVRDAATGIPLHDQEPMTLRQAMERHSREVDSCMRLFGVRREDADKWWEVFDTERKEIVL